MSSVLMFRLLGRRAVIMACTVPGPTELNIDIMCVFVGEALYGMPFVWPIDL